MSYDESERRDEPLELRDAEDRALWRLLGVVDDVEPAPDLRERVLEELNAVPSGRSLRFPWRIAAAAAAVILLIFAGRFLAGAGDGGVRDETGASQATVDSSALARSLDGITELDLIALEVDELESIQDDWFGG